MKGIMRLLFASTLALVLAAPILAQDPPAPAPGASQGMMGKSRTHTGEIMDSACAKMGSHDAMMKQEGSTSAKDCSDKCVQNGSTYVLYDPATKRTYQLSDQDKAKGFSGQKVTVTGTYDRKDKTITVTDIAAAS